MIVCLDLVEGMRSVIYFPISDTTQHFIICISSPDIPAACAPVLELPCQSPDALTLTKVLTQIFSKNNWNQKGHTYCTLWERSRDVSTVNLSTSCFKSLSCSESWKRCFSLNLTSYSSYWGLWNLLNSIINTHSWVILLFTKTQFDSANLIIQLMQLRFVESVDNA